MIVKGRLGAFRPFGNDILFASSSCSQTSQVGVIQVFHVPRLQSKYGASVSIQNTSPTSSKPLDGFHFESPQGASRTPFLVRGRMCVCLCPQEYLRNAACILQ